MPIPWTAMNDYAKLQNFDDMQTRDLYFYISRMDEVFLKWASAKNGNNK